MADDKPEGDDFKAEIEDILKDVEVQVEKPQLPLVFTSRDGETRQIGIVELQEDGTIIGTVYAGAQASLPALFSLPLGFSIDGNYRFERG